MILYWIIVVQITKYYWDEATFHYRMGAMHYGYSNREGGEREGKEADKYKQKGNNTLLWLPKIVRPKSIK